MAAKKERPAPAKAPTLRPAKGKEQESKIASKSAFTGSGRADLSQEEVRKLVSEAAYYRAKQRGFTPGHEIEDWVQAEAEVMRRIAGRENRSP
jgi:DUF2934 family protein